jgi:hypothetical protein
MRLATDVDGTRRLYQGMPWGWLQVASWAPTEAFPEGGVEIDPTVVTTSTSATATAYGSQAKTARLPSDGAKVWVDQEGSNLVLRYSLDGGTTPLTPTVGATIGAYTNASIDVDSLDRIILICVASNNNVMRFLGTPNADRSQWTWTSGTVQSASAGYTQANCVTRVHQEGSAHRVHVWWTNTNGTSDETRYIRYTLANDGTWTIDSGSSATLGSYSGRFIAGIDTAKNLYVAYNGSATFKKGTYSGGSWTWGAAEVPGLGLSINLNTLGNAVIPSSGILYMTLRDSGGNTRVIQRTAAGAWSIIHTIASTTGNPVLGLDQLENVLLVYPTATGVFYKKLTVSSGTWSSPVIIDTATTANYLSTTAAVLASSFDFLCVTGSASPYSIVFNTVVLNQAPLAPDNLAPTGTGLDATQTITLTATAHDDAGDYPTDAQWQVTDGTTTWYVKADGTITATATWVPTGGGTFSLSRAIAAGQLTNGKSYQWRVMTRDQGGLSSPWSAYAAFSATAAPVTSIVTPAIGATITTSQVTVTVSVSGSLGTVTYRLYADVAGAKGALLKTVTASGATKTISYNLTTGTYYWAEAFTTSPDGVVGAADSHRFQVSFIPPSAPGIAVEAQPANGRNRVTLSGQGAEVARNDLYRRIAGGGWIRIADNVAPNGTYDDYAAPSGAFCEYQGDAIGTNGTATASPIVGATLNITDLWVHAVGDGSSSLRVERVTARNADSQAEVTMLAFAGRSRPVAAFGDTDSAGYHATLIIRDQAMLTGLVSLRDRKTTLCFRDNAGRVVFGVIPALPITDELWGGWTVTLDVVEVAYDEEV